MIPEMRTAIALNKADLRALEVLERCPSDFITLKTQHMLNEAGVLQTHTSTAQQGSPPSIACPPSHESKRSKIWETIGRSTCNTKAI
ncbi:hypothetical protein Fmac_027740 [Flemingia macrophylla]|uniref:Uncharacterized protein n=1 Tax=Flemingia macrophylla TaxID=520843 RepID=A0ABD1LIS3_9FABA